MMGKHGPIPGGKEPAKPPSKKDSSDSSDTSDSSDSSDSPGPAGLNGHADGDFGGDGKFTLPADHVAAISVPSGGASCANCRFVEDQVGGAKCSNEHYIVWNGGKATLPVAPETYVSDWWEQGSKDSA
jgi:hypothetical protein